ncbi:hypothetical protein [Aeromonas encheleia]|uniref:Uncharacterized protein n=1 Tax=Aeromonas encheleia TaxID=73010 RepID=A0AAE9MIA6_9GAMM|nr:hypothetical protein [Aeromonas encheleia]USV58649.1 hypothetical protein NHF51_05745 [Aeromonas encheleia]
MLFEKLSLNKPISLDSICLLLIIVIATAYITYGACMINGLVGNYDSNYDSNYKVTFFDFINGVAQIATALAFVLAWIQYRKNITQQRQLIIAAEARIQIDKMVVVIESIKVGNETNLTNIDQSITQLSNIATNFDELYSAMEEDIHKAIVRMQWQDMHFNHLRRIFSDIDPVEIIRSESSISDAELDLAVVDAQEESEKAIIPYKKYVFIQTLINHPIISPKFSLKDKFNSLDMFVVHFLNDKNLDCLFYGLMSHVDIRVCAPILAVAEPSQWALEKIPSR